MLAKLRGQGSTMREAARFLGISYTTFKDSLKREPLLRQAWDRGKGLHTIALKRRMYELAMEGSVPMIRLLAKRLLGE